jgi:hypothetical protein
MQMKRSSHNTLEEKIFNNLDLFGIAFLRTKSLKNQNGVRIFTNIELNLKMEIMILESKDFSKIQYTAIVRPHECSILQEESDAIFASYVRHDYVSVAQVLTTNSEKDVNRYLQVNTDEKSREWMDNMIRTY